MERRLSSPVTRTSARPAIATANTQRSVRSRIGTLLGFAGFSMISAASNTAFAAVTCSLGSLSSCVRARSNSTMITSFKINSCSDRTVRRTSAHNQRLAKAVTSTFVSRQTLKKSLGTRHPLRGGPYLRQKALFDGELPRTGAQIAVVEVLHERDRFGIGRFVLRDDQVEALYLGQEG